MRGVGGRLPSLSPRRDVTRGISVPEEVDAADGRSVGRRRLTLRRRPETIFERPRWHEHSWQPFKSLLLFYYVHHGNQTLSRQRSTSERATKPKNCAGNVFRTHAKKKPSESKWKRREIHGRDYQWRPQNSRTHSQNCNVIGTVASSDVAHRGRRFEHVHFRVQATPSSPDSTSITQNTC